MKRKKVTTELGTIDYAVRKGNKLIVFLNGFGSFDTEQIFTPIIRELPEEVGIFAPDYLNSGFSERSLKDYTLSDEAAKLAEIINTFNAKEVIIVAHSIGGVYAFQMQRKVKNLSTLISIEPTTREIILNPPQNIEYLQKQKEVKNVEEKIRRDIVKNFTEKEAQEFWKVTEENSKKFDQNALINAQNSFEKDVFLKEDGSLNTNITSIIITEKYRQREYKRSEYFSKNLNNKIITLGSYHYLQLEHPKEIANIIEKVIKTNNKIIY